MNSPWLATFFNMTIVVLVWWTTNRLTHECCVDSNPTAGDIGVLTGTARRVHNAIAQASLPTGLDRKEQPMIVMNELQAVDPT